MLEIFSFSDKDLEVSGARAMNRTDCDIPFRTKGNSSFVTFELQLCSELRTNLIPTLEHTIPLIALPACGLAVED